MVTDASASRSVTDRFWIWYEKAWINHGAGNGDWAEVRERSRDTRFIEVARYAFEKAEEAPENIGFQTKSDLYDCFARETAFPKIFNASMVKLIKREEYLRVLHFLMNPHENANIEAGKGKTLENARYAVEGILQRELVSRKMRSVEEPKSLLKLAALLKPEANGAKPEQGAWAAVTTAVAQYPEVVTWMIEKKANPAMLREVAEEAGKSCFYATLAAIALAPATEPETARAAKWGLSRARKADVDDALPSLLLPESDHNEKRLALRGMVLFGDEYVAKYAVEKIIAEPAYLNEVFWLGKQQRPGDFALERAQHLVRELAREKDPKRLMKTQ